MPWWIVGLSLFAASISSTTLIGQSGDAYHTGVAVFNYNLTGVVVMVFFATFLLPLYIRSGIFTIPRVPRTALRQAVALLLFRNLHRGQHLSRCGRGAVCRRADHQVVVPGGGLAAHHHHLRRAGGFVHHSGRSFVGDQCRADSGGDSDCRVGDPYGACFANGGFDYLASLFESGDMSVRLIRPLTDTATPWLGLIVGMPVLGHLFLGQQPDARTARVERAERRRGPQRGDVRRSADAGHPVHHRLSGRYRPPSLPGHRETRHDLSDDGAAPAAHGVAGDHAFGAARRADVDVERHSELHVDALTMDFTPRSTSGPTSASWCASASWLRWSSS